MKKYNQLNQKQRYQIECLLSQGLKQTYIAVQIGCDKSTISRELKRNVGKQGRGAGVYDASLAQKKTDNRNKEKRKHKRLTNSMLDYIRKQLKEQKWSP